MNIVYIIIINVIIINDTPCVKDWKKLHGLTSGKSLSLCKLYNI